ncbi:hypothetical protein I7I53_05314 [Histoplasma capsulatum var. duboisii H88]|uniref:Uncharacterized protein n=1 Tax=Ajellomyces capsulatus (strain H88) TaxID=544711 RepID=A0A8A1LRR2_AJEC8|nr:hypothetical protein I7I53_05314 [Histoplasma capsulatum var. duboisii H88]
MSSEGHLRRGHRLNSQNTHLVHALWWHRISQGSRKRGKNSYSSTRHRLLYPRPDDYLEEG